MTMKRGKRAESAGGVWGRCKPPRRVLAESLENNLSKQGLYTPYLVFYEYENSTELDEVA